MTSAILFSHVPDLSPEDYCILGLATCFLKEDGEIHQVQIIEPIPSAYLEALLKEISTSYQLAIAQPLGKILVDNKPQIPEEFPEEAQFCDNFVDRLIAAARTYKKRPEATKQIPLGTVYREFNYSLDKKRVLNSTNIVRTEDNVKQHVYTHQVL